MLADVVGKVIGAALGENGIGAKGPWLLILAVASDMKALQGEMKAAGFDVSPQPRSG